MAVATLREVRGVYGATLGFLKRRLTGREPAPVASFFPRGARRRGNGMSTNKRGRVRPTHEWDLLVPLFEWPEQERYETMSPGRPSGVRKADFVAVEAIRKLAQNPGLGAFRVHAAMKQMGFDLSRATCGRILAMIREVYGYEKLEGRSGATRAMPFAASVRHEVWSADVRHLAMVDESLVVFFF